MKLWAGADHDGTVKVFHNVAGEMRPISMWDQAENNVWAGILKALGCQPGEMPRVELRRDEE